MASPQYERGYTKIATELLKEIYFRITNPTHLRLLLFTIRFTYGYNRRDFDTNLTSIGKALRLTPEYCRDMLIDISENRRILKVEWKSLKIVNISVVKDYEKWQIEK